MNKQVATHYARKNEEDAPPPSDDPLMRNRTFHSIVPRSSVAGTSLTLVIGIMAFLASLTLGAVSLVNDTAQAWQSDIAREVTIQVREKEGADLEKALNKVRQIAGGYSGVIAVSVLDEEAMGRLLEPWLGSGLAMDELPVPRLVTLTLDENEPPDLVALRRQIEKEVPQASLDDHRVWVDRLTMMARATIIGGLLVFILMMASTVLTVVFATRGAMSGNRHVIDVLHFVGAERSYIAGQFQRHFLLLGLKGALSGGLLAIMCFLLVNWWAAQNIADPAADQATALFGTFSVGWTGYLGTLVLVFGIAVLTALTSRFTVFRHVGTLDRSVPSPD